MSLIKILETENWLIEYDAESKSYRVSYFEDNHFKDDCWFSSYAEVMYENNQ